MSVANYDDEFFLENGYWVVPCTNLKALEELRNSVIKMVNRSVPGACDLSLSEIHKAVNKSDVNSLRMEIFSDLNSDPNLRNKYFSLGKDYIEHLCGTELAANTKVNFSIQLPGDETSILPSHCDTFSGESSYQINLWVPLTKCHGDNSMHIFSPSATDKILSDMQGLEQQGLNSLFDKYTEGRDYVKLALDYGQVVIFTPTVLHGNNLNTTDHTRISFNCRFKNLHSPYNAPHGSSKVLGQFYSPLTQRLATKIGKMRSLDRLVKIV